MASRSDHDHDTGEHHEHDHDHDHVHEHGDGEHSHGILATLRELLPFGHGHTHGAARVDAALTGSARGIWALKVSLLGLGATAFFQLLIVWVSGSVALLADMIHNASDALTALPLGVAFVLGRRPPTRRYTYGYGRAEDVAGVLIVVMIFASSLVAAYESYRKLIAPTPLRNPGWVAIAGLVGFLGNEGVALFRIKIGREIGSAALVADGEHARVDGFTSLAVLIGVLGTVLGFPLADPLIGLLITVAILFITKDAALMMWERLMDAVDPAVVDSMQRVASEVPGVLEATRVRVCWLGHRLQAELDITVNDNLPTRESHRIAEEVRHALFHAEPPLAVINVHVNPSAQVGEDPHHVTGHHDKQ